MSKFFKKGIDGAAGQTLIYIIVSVTIVLVLLPLYVTILFSFKSNNDFLYSMWALPEKFMVSNWSSATADILPNMFNSLIISGVTTFMVVGIASVTAYVFVRLEFFGKKLIFNYLILLMLIPSVITLPPLYILCVRLNIDNTWFALWFPAISGGQISAMFLFTTFFKQQPKFIFDAAQIDGASHLRMYFVICLPLVVPILCVQAITTFAGSYNEFLWPSIIIQQTTKQPLMPVLRNLANVAEVRIGQGAPYAMYLLSGVPLIVTSLIGLRFFFSGEFASGLKL